METNLVLLLLFSIMFVDPDKTETGYAGDFCLKTNISLNSKTKVHSKVIHFNIKREVINKKYTT